MKTIMTTCGALALLIPLGWALPETSDAGGPPFFGKPGNCDEFQSRALSRRSRSRATCSNRSRADTDHRGHSSFRECEPGRSSGDHDIGCESGNCSLKRQDRRGNAAVERPPTTRRQTRILKPNTSGLHNNSPLNPADRKHRQRMHDEVRTTQIEWSTNVDRAFRESRTSGKPVVMKLGADWCNACRRMDRETFSRSAITRLIQSCFVPLRVDIDDQTRLAENLRITAVPTVIVFSPEGEVLQRIEGFQSDEKMQTTLRPFCSNLKKNRIQGRSRSHPRD